MKKDQNEVFTFGSSEFGKLGNGILEKHVQENPFKLNLEAGEVGRVACAAVHTVVLIKV
jgi:alpha-tubulin suppressor-like RCC1 family protein